MTTVMMIMMLLVLFLLLLMMMMMIAVVVARMIMSVVMVIMMISSSSTVQRTGNLVFLQLTALPNTSTCTLLERSEFQRDWNPGPLDGGLDALYLLYGDRIMQSFFVTLLYKSANCSSNVKKA